MASASVLTLTAFSDELLPISQINPFLPRGALEVMVFITATEKLEQKLALGT